jgi:hypothetical protein
MGRINLVMDGAPPLRQRARFAWEPLPCADAPERRQSRRQAAHCRAFRAFDEATRERARVSFSLHRTIRAWHVAC